MIDPALPVIVVPCFDEEKRLDPRAFADLAASGRVSLLFVDDGSTDGTTEILHDLRDSAPAVDVLGLPANQGKGEAVRRGLLRAIESGSTVVGYYDADLATPPDELLRIVDHLLARPDVALVMGSRVRLLGRSIVRSPARHYLGRIFATLASLVLELPVYDTQCGAKVMRVSPALARALERPFRSSWIFDVELIGRLLAGEGKVEPVPATAFAEVPLQEYRNVRGSKIGARDMARALADLIVVRAELRRSGRR